MNFFSTIGSRSDGGEETSVDSSVSFSEAKVTPCMPSRPFSPYQHTLSPGFCCPLRHISVGMMPRVPQYTSGLPT